MKNRWNTKIPTEIAKYRKIPTKKFTFLHSNPVKNAFNTYSSHSEARLGIPISVFLGPYLSEPIYFLIHKAEQYLIV